MANEVATIGQLMAGSSGQPRDGSPRSGGVIVLNIPQLLRPAVHETYRKAMKALARHRFWSDGGKAQYRPEKGLWLPQRRAIAFAHAYLSVRRHQSDDVPQEAALIKMPTGTGKTGVIAALACSSPLVRRTLILTPRAGLVRQMTWDLSFRFWSRALSAAYYHSEVHEDLNPEELASFASAVKSGEVSPVRVLLADQYKEIWAEREQTRQILVSTFNALHLNLGIDPPPHRSMYGRDTRPVAKSLRELETVKAESGSVGSFKDLLKAVDLVIVDEGHYEPAYSWAQAVRAIGKPTIIFTATPYRNDYKYFQIDGNFVFNLPWQEAVHKRLVREVRFAAPLSSNASTPQRATVPQRIRKGAYSPRRFVEEFSATLRRLPAGKKVIVHAATFQSLKALQRAFGDKEEPAVVIHDAFTGQEMACPDLNALEPRKRELLKGLRFRHVTDAEEHRGAQESRVWMHQFKLLEGIDDSRFVEVWLYDGLGSARQVVQQIGRAIRRPDLADKTGQMATIRGSSKPLDSYDGAPTVAEQTEQRWKDYLAYEEYAARRVDVAFIAETQLLASVKRVAPAVQYISGEFRGGHLLDQSPTMAAFLLPRRGVVCRVDGVFDHSPKAIADSFLDRLQADAMEAMLLEERFDIAAVRAPEGRTYHDIRLIRYLAWGNSPYLSRHHIPEWRLGIMAMVRAGRYLVVLDTEGICVDYARVGLLSPDSAELKRLFPRTAQRGQSRGTHSGTRIVETVASGLDIGELGLRSISVRRHALEEGYFDLAEASQVPVSVRGYGQLGARTARRNLSFSRSSVSDATSKLLSVKDYIAWAGLIGDAMADERIRAHAYFERFAREVRPPDESAGVPRSILLDLWDLLDVADETREQRHWDGAAVEELLRHDTCCEIQERRKKPDDPPRYCFDFGPHELEVKYHFRNTVPPSGHYSIAGGSLNAAVVDADSDATEGKSEHDNSAFGRQLSASLTRLINQEQAFRIIPSAREVVYSHFHFYKPEVNEAVLSLLEPCALLKSVVSEKGDTRVQDPARWAVATLFGLMYGWSAVKPPNVGEFARDVHNCTTLLCDDRTGETADFYGIDDNRRRVMIVHAKAEDGNPGVSARKLQEITRQAQSSLAFAGSSNREFLFPKQWCDDWEVVLQEAGGLRLTRGRMIKGPNADPKAAHVRLLEALSNPTYTKEVVMLTSGILSARAAKRAHESATQRDLQFLYFLASVRTTFDRAGVRYRIICNE
jgi:hypothetical protein